MHYVKLQLEDIELNPNISRNKYKTSVTQSDEELHNYKGRKSVPNSKMERKKITFMELTPTPLREN